MPKRAHNNYWDRPENLERLHALYRDAPMAEVLAAFPGKSKDTIVQAASKRGIKRTYRLGARIRTTTDPLIEALYRRRVALGWSRHKTSVEMGADETLVSIYERGACVPSYAFLKKWCAALGMVLDVRPKLAVVANVMADQAKRDMAAWKKRRAA